MIASKKVFHSAFGFLLLVLLILAGGFLYRTFDRETMVPSNDETETATSSNGESGLQDSSDSLPPEIPPEERKQTERQENLTAMKKAMADDDESLCHGVTDQNLRRECFDRIRLRAALHIEEIELCTLIADPKTKEYCFDNFIEKKATTEKNPRLCLQIADEIREQNCLKNADQGLFLTAETPEDCEKIQNRDTKKTCIDHFRLQDLRNYEDPSVCGKFLTPDGKSECEDYFWNKRALSERDPTLCLRIPGKEEQVRCETSMRIAIQKEEKSKSLFEGKSEHCADFLSEELKIQCENEANYYAAKIHRNTEYCKKIKDSADLAGKCVLELTALNDKYCLSKAKEEKRSDYCEKITDSGMIEYCRTVL